MEYVASQGQYRGVGSRVSSGFAKPPALGNSQPDPEIDFPLTT